MAENTKIEWSDSTDTFDDRYWDIAEKLQNIIGTLEFESAYWVSSPADDGMDYCYECCEAEVAKARIADPENADDIVIDGGWSREHDNPVQCDNCGKELDGGLTDYGAESELEYFSTWGFHEGNRVESYEIDRMLGNLLYSKNRELTQAAFAVASAFIAATDHARYVEPSRWADDGGYVP